ARLCLTTGVTLGAALAIQIPGAYRRAELRIALSVTAAIAVRGSRRVRAGAITAPVALDARAGRARTGTLPFAAAARKFTHAFGSTASRGATFASSLAQPVATSGNIAAAPTAFTAPLTGSLESRP